VQFPFVGPADIWTPRYFEFSLMTPQRLRMGVGYLSMIARLRPAITMREADAELAVLNQRYREQNPTAPDSSPDMAMTGESLRDLVAGDVRSKVAVLSAAVGVVLLIACANVASLLLARVVARQKEIAMRAALGAGRGVIFRQLLTESLMLAMISGLLGALLGWMAMEALARWGAGQLPAGIPLELDVRVLAFTLVVSVFAGVLLGAIPALQSARVDLNATLRNEGGAASAGRRRTAITNTLVIGQVALSLLLLIGAGLFLRSFVRLLHVDPGFESRNVLTMNVSLSTTKYAKPDQQIAFFDDVLRRVSALPGVRSTATSATLPLSWVRVTPILPEGQPEVPLGERPFVDIEAISPQWFETMHVPVRAGRAFTADDRAQAPPVVIANETLARQYWPNENPIGKHVLVGRRPVPAEVIGVAADVRNKGLEQATQPQLYLPFSQLPWNDTYLLVRTNVPPGNIASAVRGQIAAVDADQPVIKIQTVDDLLDNARTQPRFLLTLVGAFAATALVLALIGIYGLLSYAVELRRQEFGIRLALGANPRDLLHLVLRRGLMLTTGGIVLGTGAALLTTRFVAGLLYHVDAHDLASFIAAPAVFVCIALLASYLPARRATRANPIDAIK
jgi:putative ABC transport system permease protein